MNRTRLRNFMDDILRSLGDRDKTSFAEEIPFACDIISLFPDNGVGSTVLDIGIGRGQRSIPLSYMNYRVYGIERSWENIYAWKDHCYRPFGIRVKECDVSNEEFPFPDNHFDWVILGELCDAEDFSPAHALSEVKRISKPGGRLVLPVPNLSLKTVDRGWKARWYTSGPLREIQLDEETADGFHEVGAFDRLDDLIQGYGFRVMLRMYRNCRTASQRLAVSGVHRLASILIPRLRDTLIMVCERH